MVPKPIITAFKYYFFTFPDCHQVAAERDAAA